MVVGFAYRLLGVFWLPDEGLGTFCVAGDGVFGMLGMGGTAIFGSVAGF